MSEQPYYYECQKCGHEQLVRDESQVCHKCGSCNWEPVEFDEEVK